MDELGALWAGEDLSMKYAAIAVSNKPNKIGKISNFFKLQTLLTNDFLEDYLLKGSDML